MNMKVTVIGYDKINLTQNRSGVGLDLSNFKKLGTTLKLNLTYQRATEFLELFIGYHSRCLQIGVYIQGKRIRSSNGWVMSEVYLMHFA